jgi:hypothetical protein
MAATKIRFPRRAASIAALLLAFFTLALAAAEPSSGPFVNGRFRGRIAYSADGNHNDPDDWAASPLALAIFAEAGLKDQLVHFHYNCILPQTNAEWERIHAESVLGAARHYGYDATRLFDCRQELDRTMEHLAREINASTADDPLYFIVAGPMEVPYRAIERSQPEKRRFVTCISHSRWNDGFAARYQFTHTKRSVIESGVHWVQIRDQNRLLSLSPYGRPGPPESFEPFAWMRDSGDAKLRFLWDRMLVSTRPDPSDAGMAYFLVTGDEDCDPVKLRRLLADRAPPAPLAARRQIRLEAENFRVLSGYEIEDLSDRTASHRLSIRPRGGQPAYAIRTLFHEPYAARSGRYDVEVRYFGEPAGQPELVLEVAGKPHAAQPHATSASGWTSLTFRGVDLQFGDDIAVTASGSPPRLDYVQFNALAND